ncbi:hypothetical protein CCMSSC00406_0002987 [Pleurotus cornucopiae]|uniref:Uncharacterized protein n=1 Tax=Pleurotus cornucopiae TaxID=5321 RepID=A0ACB7J5Z4_PLECO|nr:hypothetical protein CCMSSC00406_0002987 [Pleurotus cornucopiae]
MFPWGELSTDTLRSVCRDLNARRTAERAREDVLELLNTLEIGVASALKKQQSMPPPPKRKYQRRIPAPVRAPAPFPMAPPTPAATPISSRTRRIARPPPIAPTTRRQDLDETPQRQRQRSKNPSPAKRRKIFDGVEVEFPHALRRHYYERCQSMHETSADLYSDQVSTPGAELEEDSQSVHSDDILTLGRA